MNSTSHASLTNIIQPLFYFKTTISDDDKDVKLQKLANNPEDSGTSSRSTVTGLHV